MLDVADMPERRRKLASPGGQKPKRAARHLAGPDGVNAVTDHNEQQRVCQNVAVRCLFDKPEPESTVGPDGFVKKPLDFPPLDFFFGVGLDAFDTLPALDAISIQETPHPVDRQAHAQHLLIQKQRPHDMARKNVHNDRADGPPPTADREDPQRGKRQDDVENSFDTLEQQHPLQAEHTLVPLLYVGFVQMIVFADVHAERLVQKHLGRARVELTHIRPQQILAHDPLVIPDRLPDNHQQAVQCQHQQEITDSRMLRVEKVGNMAEHQRQYYGQDARSGHPSDHPSHEDLAFAADQFHPDPHHHVLHSTEFFFVFPPVGCNSPVQIDIAHHCFSYENGYGICAHAQTNPPGYGLEFPRKTKEAASDLMLL